MQGFDEDREEMAAQAWEWEEGEIEDVTAGVEELTAAERARLNARRALIAAGELPAPNLAESRARAAELGVPEEVARILPDDVAFELKARRMEKLPRLAAWAAENEGNGALARDNVEWALEIATDFENFWPGRNGDAGEGNGRAAGGYGAYGGLDGDGAAEAGGEVFGGLGPGVSGQRPQALADALAGLPGAWGGAGELAGLLPGDGAAAQSLGLAAPVAWEGGNGGGGLAPGLLGLDVGQGAGPVGEMGQVAVWPESGEGAQGAFGEDGKAVFDGAVGRFLKEGLARIGGFYGGLWGGIGQYQINLYKSLWNGLIDLPVNALASVRGIADVAGGTREEQADWRRFGEFLGRGEEWLEGLRAEVKADNVVSGFAQDFMRQLPQFAGSVGGSLVNPLLGIGFMANQIYGGSYRELRKKGVDPVNANTGALINTAGQTPLEYLGASRIGRFLTGDALTSGIRRQLFGLAAVEGLTEAAQKLPEYLGHAWAESSLHANDMGGRWQWFTGWATDPRNLWQGTKEAAYEGLLGAIMGGMAGAVKVAWHRPALLEGSAGEVQRLAGELTRKVADARALDTLFRKAGEIGRDVDGAARLEILRRAVPQSHAQMWLSGEDALSLFQEEGELEPLGLGREDLERAAQGQAVAVETARALAAEGTLGQKARDKLRIDPQGLSAEETGGWDADRIFGEMARTLMQEEEAEAELDEELEQAAAELDQELGEDALEGDDGRQEPGEGALDVDVGRPERGGIPDARTRRGLRRVNEWKVVFQAVNQQIGRIRNEMLAAGMTRQEADNQSLHLQAHALAFWRTYGTDPAQRLSRISFLGDPEVTGSQDNLPPDNTPDNALPPGPGDFSLDNDPRYNLPPVNPEAAPLNPENITDENLPPENIPPVNPENIPDDNIPPENLPPDIDDELARQWAEELAAEEEARNAGQDLAPDNFAPEEMPEDPLAGQPLRDGYPRNMGAADWARFWAEEKALEEQQAVEEGQDRSLNQDDVFDAESTGALDEIFYQDEPVGQEGQQSSQQEGQQTNQREGQQASQQENSSQDASRDAEEQPDQTRGIMSAEELAEWEAAHPEDPANPDTRLIGESDEAWQERIRRKYPPNHPFWYDDALAADTVSESMRESDKDRRRLRRGKVEFRNGRALVTLFRHFNVSTTLHECGHIYIEELLAVARDKGGIARDSLLRNLGLKFQGELLEELRNQFLAVEAQTEMERLDKFRQSLEAQIKEREDAIRAELARGKDRNAALIRQLRSLRNQRKRALREAIRAQNQARALDQARRDVARLARNAGLDQAQTQALLEGRGRPEEWVRMQEESARAFVAWFMRGKAPSNRLKPAFARFADWLTRLYGSVRRYLGQDVNPQVAQVFDRLLATNEEIARKSGLEEALELEERFANSSIFDYRKRRELEYLRQQAKAAAAMVDKKAALERLERFRKRRAKEIMEELKKQPFWRIVATRGLDFDEMASILGQEAAEQLRASQPELFSGTRRSLLELNIEQGGLYVSEEALAQEIFARLSQKGSGLAAEAAAQANAEARAAMQSLTDAAAMRQSKAYERYLKRADEIFWEQLLKKMGSDATAVMPNREAIRQEARKQIRAMPYMNVKINSFRAMLDRALRDREAALISGNTQRLIDSMRRARMANELICQTLEAQQLHRSLEYQIRLAQNQKGDDFLPLHREAQRALLKLFGLKEMKIPHDSDFAGKSLAELLDQVYGEQDKDSPCPNRPPIASWLLNARPLSRIELDYVSVGQLEDITNLFRALRKTGQDAMDAIRGEESRRRNAIVWECATRMDKLPPFVRHVAKSLRRAAQRLIQRGWSEVDALRWQMDRADGLTSLPGIAHEMGPMAKLADRARQAENEMRKSTEEFKTALAPHVAALAKSLQALRKRQGKYLRGSRGQIIALPQALASAYGEKGWTVDRLIAVALNCGNESNMGRIVSGYEDFSYDMLAELIGDDMATKVFEAYDEKKIGTPMGRGGLLSVEDWTHVQGIWDALSIKWKAIEQTNLKLYGFKPSRIEPEASTVGVADGAVQLKGGYYPVVYDSNISDDARRFEEQDDILDRLAPHMQTSRARDSFAQERAEGPPPMPLRLDTSLMLEHVRDVVKFIHMAPIAREIDVITRNDIFKDAYIRAFGEEDYSGIRPNLRGLVRNERNFDAGSIIELADKIRPYLVYWGLAWNLKVAALQATAVFPAMGDIGAMPMLKAMAYMTKNGWNPKNGGMLAQIHQVSPYMKSRLFNLDQDLRLAMDKLSFKRRHALRLGKTELTLQDLVELGMKPIIIVDAMATGAVWLAAYNTKMQAAGAKANHIDTEARAHAEAVRYADQMVQASNPDFDATSRSAFLRDHKVNRLFNGFASATTLFAQRAHQMSLGRQKGLVNRRQMTRFAFYEYMAPAIGFSIFLGLVRGLTDEPDKFFAMFFNLLMDNLAMRVPVFGPILEDVALKALDVKQPSSRFSSFRTTIDTPFQIADATLGAIPAVVKDKEDAGKKMLLGTLDAVSFVSRLPFSRIYKNWTTAQEQREAGQGNFFSFISPRPKSQTDDREVMYGIIDGN